jgi:hypothetical protein
MNYCRQNYWGDKSLSKTDEVSVKAYYGRIPTFNADTLRLDIPRVIIDGKPYTASLIYVDDKKLTLESKREIDSSQGNLSSTKTTFANSIIDLPLFRFMAGGKVLSLHKATLTLGGDGKFVLSSIDVHPDTKIE